MDPGISNRTTTNLESVDDKETVPPVAYSSKDHPCIIELYIHKYCIKYAHRQESIKDLVGAYALYGIKSSNFSQRPTLSQLE